jgi:hypothetical protein
MEKGIVMDLLNLPINEPTIELTRRAENVDRDSWPVELESLAQTLPMIRSSRKADEACWGLFREKGFSDEQIVTLYNVCCDGEAKVIEALAYSLEDFHLVRLNNVIQFCEPIDIHAIGVWTQQDKPAIMAAGYRSGSSSSRLPMQKLQEHKDIYAEIDLASLYAAENDEKTDFSSVSTEELVNVVFSYAQMTDRDSWIEELSNLSEILPTIRAARVVKKESEVYFSKKGFNSNQIEMIYGICCANNAYIFEALAKSMDNYYKSRLTEAIVAQKLITMETIRDWVFADKSGILREEEERGYYRRERHSLYT